MTSPEYHYIAFLLSTVYFVARLAAQNEEEQVKISRYLNLTILSSLYTQLTKNLTEVQRKELVDLTQKEFSFKDLNSFFATRLGNETLSSFSLDALESEFRSAVRAALGALQGEAREKFKTELFKEYRKYQLTDI